MINKTYKKPIVASISVMLLLTIATCASAQIDTLTLEQRAKLKQFAQEYRQNSMQLRQALHTARKDLAKQYEQVHVDESSTQAAIETLSKAQMALLSMHLNNQLSIRQILTEDQFKMTVGRFTKDRPHRPHMSGMDDYPDKNLLDSLALTPDQQKQLKKLPAFDKRRLAETKSMNEDTKKLMQSYSEYRLKEPRAQRLISSIHQHQRNLTQISHKTLKLLHSVLNREQIKQLEEPRKNLLDRMKTWRKPGQEKRERSFGDTDRGYTPSPENY